MPADRIVVAGSSNTDMILNLSRMPRPGETILGGSFTMVGGGKGANQAIAAARTGGSVSLVGRVGEDGFGQQSLCAFKDEGIGVDHVVIDASIASGVALIFVGPDGENSIGVAEGANGRVSVEQVQEAASLIQSAHILLVQLEIPLDSVGSAVSLAAEHGVRVILDPAPAASLDEDLLARVSILTPNELEAETLTEIAVRDPDSAARAAKEALVSRRRNRVAHSRSLRRAPVRRSGGRVFPRTRGFRGGYNRRGGRLQRGAGNVAQPWGRDASCRAVRQRRRRHIRYEARRPIVDSNQK